MKKQFIIAAALAGAAFATQAAVIDVTSDISVDTTWVSTNDYRLTDIIFVKDGATLTIEAGTVIRGFDSPVVGEDGSLVITRGSKINAVGTKDNPIVFTDYNDTNVRGAADDGSGYFDKNNGIFQQWGGVLMLGETYVATDDGGAGTPSPNASLLKQIEGMGSFGALSQYGGGNDDDNSGVFRYVTIRYGGSVYGTDNEINGLTLGAVGRGTTIDHVEVFQNKDDGVEFFGGTVDTKNMIVWSVGDDGFDWDQGFRGKGQFWLVAQGPLGTSDKSDKGAEMDGGDGDASQPSACPTVYNATYIGLDQASNGKNTALQFRDGTAGRYYNSIFMDFGGSPMNIEGNVTNGIGDSAFMVTNNYVNDVYYTHEANGSKMLELKGNVFYNIAGSIPSDGAEGALVGGDANKDYHGPADGYDPLATDNIVAATSPIAFLLRDPIGNDVGGTIFKSIDSISLVPVADAAVASIDAPVDGFFVKTAYAGAFGSYNWAAGWSTADSLGYFVGMNNTVPAPVIDGNVAYNLEWDSVAGVTYHVEQSQLDGSWEVIGIFEGNGGLLTFAAEMEFDSMTYRVVVP